MSNLVFPYYLQGQKLAVSRRMIAGSTGLTRAVSGVAAAIAKQPWPRWGWTLSWEFLDDSKVRSNLCPNAIDLTAWSKSATGAGVLPVVSANTYAAPDGTWTADSFTLDVSAGSTSGDTASVSQTLTLGAGTFTDSIWLRTTDGTTIGLNLYNPTGSGSTTAVTVMPTWQRFLLTGVCTTTTQIGPKVFGNTVNGVTTKIANLAMWGGQAESGTLASAFIPTGASALTVSDLKTLTGFVGAMRGSYDTFLWLDPEFNTVQQQQFGTGNGSTTAFQLQAQYSTDGLTLGPNGFPDIVQNTFGAPQIFVNGVLKTVTTDYTISSTGVVTFTTAPAAAAVLTWTGSFYHRARFTSDDPADSAAILYRMWETKSLEFESEIV